MYLDTNYISTVVTDECASNSIYKKQILEMALLQIQISYFKTKIADNTKRTKKRVTCPEIG